MRDDHAGTTTNMQQTTSPMKQTSLLRVWTNQNIGPRVRALMSPPSCPRRIFPHTIPHIHCVHQRPLSRLQQPAKQHLRPNRDDLAQANGEEWGTLRGSHFLAFGAQVLTRSNLVICAEPSPTVAGASRGRPEAQVGGSKGLPPHAVVRRVGSWRARSRFEEHVCITAELIVSERNRNVQRNLSWTCSASCKWASRLAAQATPSLVHGGSSQVNWKLL